MKETKHNSPHWDGNFKFYGGKRRYFSIKIIKIIKMTPWKKKNVTFSPDNLKYMVGTISYGRISLK